MAPEDIYNCKQKPDYLLVLVHGILSSSSDWTYATTVLKSQLTNNFLIYASSCNSYTKTFDGIDRSGRRLAEEVLDVVRSTGSLRKISFLAHSLGGLFTRYAIALLCSASTFQKDLHDVDLNGNSGHSLNLGTIAGLEPINFITLATPHIGIRGKKQMMRPELEQLKEQINKMDPQSVVEGQQQVKALFQKYGVSPFTPLKGLFIQGPIFISFFLAISNMAEKVPSFKGGGALWFTDLTTPDPQYILPALTALSFLVTVELNMQEGMEGNPHVNTMKNFSRVLALMTVPFTAHFPKAIFCYWITSNLFSLMYGCALRRSPVRRFLNLPDVVPEPNPATQPDVSFLRTSKPMTETPSPLPAKDSEQNNNPERRISSSSVISQRIRSLEKTLKTRNKLKKR